jgi:hypothetical protein
MIGRIEFPVNETRDVKVVLPNCQRLKNFATASVRVRTCNFS